MSVLLHNRDLAFEDPVNLTVWTKQVVHKIVSQAVVALLHRSCRGIGNLKLHKFGLEDVHLQWSLTHNFLPGNINGNGDLVVRVLGGLPRRDFGIGLIGSGLLEFLLSESKGAILFIHQPGESFRGVRDHDWDELSRL